MEKGLLPSSDSNGRYARSSSSFEPDPIGILMFDGRDRASLQEMRADLPKFTADEGARPVTGFGLSRPAKLCERTTGNQLTLVRTSPGWTEFRVHPRNGSREVRNVV